MAIGNDDRVTSENEPAAAAPAEPPLRPERLRALSWFAGLLLAIGLAWILRAATMVALPLAVALFVALAVWPVCRWVQSRVSPRLQWLGYVAAMALVVLVLALFVSGIVIAAQQLTGKIPTDPAQLGLLQQQLKATASRSGIASLFGSSEVVGQLSQVIRTIGSHATKLLSGVTSLLSGLVLVFFLVLLMLIEAPIWSGKLRTLSGPGGTDWHEIVGAIGSRFRRFFLTRLMLGAITGTLYAAWLALFGVDLLLVWGLLAFLLNFVPTIGSLIAGLFPVIYVFFSRDTATALAIGGGILVIEQVMGNYVEPRLLGSRLAISPLVVLVALLFWSWLWGVTGALMAVPMMVLITMIFAHIPAMRPVALLFGNAPDIEELEERTGAGPANR